MKIMKLIKTILPGALVIGTAVTVPLVSASCKETTTYHFVSAFGKFKVDFSIDQDYLSVNSTYTIHVDYIGGGTITWNSWSIEADGTYYDGQYTLDHQDIDAHNFGIKPILATPTGEYPTAAPIAITITYNGSQSDGFISGNRLLFTIK